ncbi:MAG: VOC family protein [Candidatus Dormibacteria bacterium]|jgi:predicted enzyme related to lactoylglutathione lyase
MKVKAISWVGVQTRAYQEMVQFFADVAGLRVEHQQPDFSVFRLPSGDKLEVFGPAATVHPAQFARNQVVVGLLVEDMDEATSRLRAAGIELLGERQAGENGYSWQHFRGPDGNVWELVTDPSHRSSSESEP